jgi:transitional endoplasmic reticulum ATPase
VQPGDIITIHGKRLTTARGWHTYPEDQDQFIIRLDSLIRKNADVALHDFVTIEKADVNAALSIDVVPVDLRLNVDRDFVNFLKSRIQNRPLVVGDQIFVVILG